MYQSKFKLNLESQESNVEVELSWSASVTLTRKGLEIVPEVSEQTVKIPKVRDVSSDDFDEYDLVEHKISKFDIQIFATEIEGDRHMVLEPDTVWIDQDDETVIITFKLI